MGKTRTERRRQERINERVTRYHMEGIKMEKQAKDAVRKVAVHEVGMTEIKNRYTGDVICSTDLKGADLLGIKNYSEIHEVFQEVVRKQKCDTFSDGEWGIIGKICIHRLCWGTISNKFGAKATPVFEKLADAGWGGMVG